METPDSPGLFGAIITLKPHFVMLLTRRKHVKVLGLLCSALFAYIGRWHGHCADETNFVIFTAWRVTCDVTIPNICIPGSLQQPAWRHVHRRIAVSLRNWPVGIGSKNRQKEIERKNVYNVCGNLLFHHRAVIQTSREINIWTIW